jgi:hypothetical protein
MVDSAINPTRRVVDVESLEWHARAGTPSEVKLLKMNEDFSYISLTRSPSGTVGPAHVHVGPTEVYFLSGKVETVAGFAETGYFVLEPAGAMHRATQILEGGAALTHVRGPMLFLDQNGAAPVAVYGESLAALVSGADAGATSLAEITAAWYPEDYDSGVVDVNQLDWVPSPYEGIEFKVARVGEDGWFNLLIRAQDGATIPARHHTGPADFYVLSGALDFGDARATKDFWVYEPTGAVEGEIRHIGETTYFATFAGAALDLDEAGSVVRIFDAGAVRQLAGRELTAAI